MAPFMKTLDAVIPNNAIRIKSKNKTLHSEFIRDSRTPNPPKLKSEIIYPTNCTSAVQQSIRKQQLNNVNQDKITSIWNKSLRPLFDILLNKGIPKSELESPANELHSWLESADINDYWVQGLVKDCYWIYQKLSGTLSKEKSYSFILSDFFSHLAEPGLQKCYDFFKSYKTFLEGETQTPTRIKFHSISTLQDALLTDTEHNLPPKLKIHLQSQRWRNLIDYLNKIHPVYISTPPYQTNTTVYDLKKVITTMFNQNPTGKHNPFYYEWYKKINQNPVNSDALLLKMVNDLVISNRLGKYRQSVPISDSNEFATIFNFLRSNSDLADIVPELKKAIDTMSTGNNQTKWSSCDGFEKDLQDIVNAYNGRLPKDVQVFSPYSDAGTLILLRLLTLTKCAKIDNFNDLFMILFEKYKNLLNSWWKNNLNFPKIFNSWRQAGWIDSQTANNVTNELSEYATNEDYIFKNNDMPPSTLEAYNYILKATTSKLQRQNKQHDSFNVSLPYNWTLNPLIEHLPRNFRKLNKPYSANLIEKCLEFLKQN